MKIIINNKSDIPLYHATTLVTEIISKGTPYKTWYDYRVNDVQVCCVVQGNIASTRFTIYNDGNDNKET